MKWLPILLLYVLPCIASAQSLSKQWDVTLGGLASDYISGTVLTCDGGFLIYGSSYSPVGGSKTSVIGDGDYWIVKIDAQGNKL